VLGARTVIGGGSGAEGDGGFAAGGRVRLKSDPARIGILTGASESRKGSTRWQVQFLDGSGAEFVPELALEPVTTDSSNPYELVRKGRFARAVDLRGALTYFRLSGRLADLIYSLNTTNTDFYAYQFKPVLSFLDSPCRGLLIADEVGLGKTIEAGLIWTELRSRDDARRLLVLCPAMLRMKWQRELSEKFGVQAELCNAAETLARMQDSAAGRRPGFAIIASLQGLRPPVGWQEETEDDRGPAAALARFLFGREAQDPLVDLTIVDEAHYLRNPETQTARLGRLLRPVTENLVLLSATPVQLRSADLFHLLNLLDRDTFPYESSFDSIVAETAPVVALRDRVLRGNIDGLEFHQALTHAMSGRRLSTSAALGALIQTPPSDTDLSDPARRVDIAERLDAANPLTRVVSRTRKRDVQERRVLRQPHAIRAPMSEVERAFYVEVTNHVRSYCSRFEIGEGFLLTIPQRQMCSSMPAACRAWQRQAAERAATAGGIDDEEVAELLAEAIADLEALDEPEAAPQRATVAPLVAELARVAQAAGDFEALSKADTKFTSLLSSLEEYWRRYPGAKVVLFSYFRETLRYLAERFSAVGVTSAVLMGGMDKDPILESFARAGGPPILLSSEVASEGIDLQFSSLVVNYDLPWNPMRIEQRVGRIDRIGQKADAILIWNLLYEGTLDDRVYSRLFERLEIFTRALGSTEAVLGEPIRRMSYDLLRHHLTPQQEAEVIEQARVALYRNERDEEQLEAEAGRLIAHGAWLQARIDTARELHRYVTGDDLFAYVKDFFERRYPGSRFVVTDTSRLLADVDLSPLARTDFAHFLSLERSQGRSRLASAVIGPAPVQFENRLQKPSADREVISQYHPVIRFVTGRLREDEAARYATVSAAVVDGTRLPNINPGDYVFAVQRWSFSGEREVERLAYAAMPLSKAAVPLGPEAAERLVTSAALRGRDWVTAQGDVGGEGALTLLHECVDDLESRGAVFFETMKRQSTDRLALQLEVLNQHRENRQRELRDRIGLMWREQKTKAARMFEAQLEQHLKRMETRRELLERKQRMSHSIRLVSVGTIRVS
jgi:hypothetical protein